MSRAGSQKRGTAGIQACDRLSSKLRGLACRSHLGSFGIGGELALQAMYTLSGGQKSRVAFAKVTYTQPHILLLDEPSNHLDIDAVRALIEVRPPVLHLAAASSLASS